MCPIVRTLIKDLLALLHLWPGLGRFDAEPKELWQFAETVRNFETSQTCVLSYGMSCVKNKWFD